MRSVYLNNLQFANIKLSKFMKVKFSGGKLPLRITLSVRLSLNNFIISLLCVYIAPRTYSLEPPFRHHTCSLHRICTPFWLGVSPTFSSSWHYYLLYKSKLFFNFTKPTPGGIVDQLSGLVSWLVETFLKTPCKLLI